MLFAEYRVDAAEDSNGGEALLRAHIFIFNSSESHFVELTFLTILRSRAWLRGLRERMRT